jgi:anti-sigma regulatory factor (Ser/Thr protein kinase)
MPGPFPHAAADRFQQDLGERAASDSESAHQLVIDGRPEQVAAARAFVRLVLGGAYPGIERAALLTSELVTNSINHSNSRGKAGTITVTVLTGAGRVHVEVADEGGPTVPAICRGNDLAEGGRGLRLVDAYSLSWDYYQKGTGMVTWFECPAEPLP